VLLVFGTGMISVKLGALGFGIGVDFGDCTGMTVTTVHQWQISAHRETSQAQILSPTLHLFYKIYCPQPNRMFDKGRRGEGQGKFYFNPLVF
jgi:hypothetical protein